MKEFVVLVDENNNEIGTMEKLEAHEKGILHRAISIFVFNDAGELLLQQRAKHKYHAGGLWTNTVCSHPRLGETYEDAVQRRLQEEMGFTCPLEKFGEIVYNVGFLEGDLREHEHDTIFIGTYNGEVNPNTEEAMDYKWINLDELKKDIKENKDFYTPWFVEIFKKFYS
ncbi:isopentenyl-diphosphate Delta-isomerase [Candidatus Gracilibacteria bacterium]|nr:isopentenyl-diphosphate Delta-isomerase [Candidatus Gracilibacteria bacterium]NUJ99375.1 isopentenyl-diphosphate Delta-isomerase [Candidatus Gracilibacteria bacterium]